MKTKFAIVVSRLPCSVSVFPSNSKVKLPGVRGARVLFFLQEASVRPIAPATRIQRSGFIRMEIMLL